jgi:hypothetical protein
MFRRLPRVMSHNYPRCSKSADYWTSKADEARMVAETMSNTEAKRAMLEIAALYEELAVRARAAESTEE